MQPVVRLRARVLQLRDVPAGETVGYNGSGRPAAQPDRHRRRPATPTATSRCLSAGRAYFDGRPVPLVGRVSMDLSTFDATDRPASARRLAGADRPA